MTRKCTSTRPINAKRICLNVKVTKARSQRDEVKEYADDCELGPDAGMHDPFNKPSLPML